MPARQQESSLNAVGAYDGCFASHTTRARPSLLISIATATPSTSGQPSPAGMSAQQILSAAHGLRARASSSRQAPVLPPLLTPSRKSCSSVSLSWCDKPLGSDLADGDAFEMLTELSTSEPLLRSFSPTQLQELCSLLTILRIKAGEIVMQAGEQASFFALLLQGSCVATVSATLGALPLPHGSWLGEMSYFQHGVRSADVQAAEDSLLAMMTYRELDALALVQPTMYSKLIKMLAVVSIRKLHERIEVMSASAATLIHMRKGSLIAAGESFLRSPSQAGRKVLGNDGGATSFRELHRTPSDANGLPYGLNTVSTPRAGSQLRANRSFSYSTDDGITQPSTPRPPNLPRSPRAFPTTVKQPSSDLLALKPQQETLLRKRLAATLQIRDAVVWQGIVTAVFEAADDREAKTVHAPFDKYTVDGESRSSDLVNHLLQTHPSMSDLQQLTRAQKLVLWDLYHPSSIDSSSKVLQPSELRRLSRDIIEVVLRNYVRWLKHSSKRINRKKQLTEADYRTILQNEREYLLPGKRGQSDAQAINAMTRHLTSQLTASKTGAGVTTHAALNGSSSMATITEEVFCMTFDRVMHKCLLIKTKDQGLNCCIQ